MRRTIGALTIGQSPRGDVVPHMREILGPGFDVIECGALDDLRPEEIDELAPRPEEYVLVTRLRDGTEVKVAKGRIMPLMQGCIESLNKAGAEMIVILCTGEFPEFRSEATIVESMGLMQSVVRGMMGGRKVGVIVPTPEQIPVAREKWERDGVRAAVVSASPYGDMGEVLEAAERLLEENVEMVVFDCIGFTEEAKRLLRRVTEKPIVVASSLVAAVIKELF